jgi:CheY-like chemotaxis protein
MVDKSGGGTGPLRRSLTLVVRQGFDRFAAVTYASTTDYIRRILIPHAFAFIALLVIGSILVQSPLSLSLRLAAVGYLVVLGVAVHSTLEYVSFRLVLLATIVLGALVIGSACILRLEAVTHIWLPCLGLIAPVVRIRFPRDGACALAGGIALVVCGGLLSSGVSSVNLGCSLLLVVLAGGILGRAVPTEKTPGMTPRGTRLSAYSASERVEPPAGSLGEAFPAHELRLLWRRTALGEFMSEVLWRVSGATIAVGGIVGITLSRLEPPRVELVGCWIALTVVQLLVFIEILRGTSIAAVMRGTFLASIVVSIWWLLLVVEPRVDRWLPELVFFIALMALVPLPWSRRTSMIIGGIYLVLGAFLALMSPAPVVVGVGVSVAVLAAIRLSAVTAVHLTSRSGLHFLRRVGEGAPTSLVAARALAWQLGQVMESERVLLLLGDRTTVVVEDTVEPSSVDPIFARGLAHTIDELGREEGEISFADLGRQFLSPAVDWFGLVPTKLYFVRLGAVIDEREERLTIVVPWSLTARLAGRVRTIRALGGMAALVRAWLSAARGRFKSSDVILESQRSLSAREEDLNHLVHLVNNVAQDISAECDSLRQGLGSDSTGSHHIEEVERLVRSMSASVSDVKLLKELLRMRVLGGSDAVDVSALIEDISAFGRYRARRGGRTFVVAAQVEASTEVATASREFLGMALRMLVRTAERRSPPGGRVTFAADLGEDGVVALSVSFHPGRIIEADERDAEVSLAVQNLARLSRGTFEVHERDGEHRSTLRLPVVSRTEHTESALDGWALLVDDNPQVTNFYARVAEAVKLTYYTAAAIAEAEALLTAHGAPRMVVTDIQLGDGSGLDLVRSVRKRFGRGVPIVVVSGNTGSEVESEVKSAGATTYLAKPVGRSRLFAEIRNLLMRTVEVE